MATTLRRKSSEVELSDIFKVMSADQQKIDDYQDSSEGLQPNGTVDSLASRHPPSPRRSMSAPSPIRLDENGNERSGPVTEADRLASLEKKVSSQQDEIAILKSALANILRRVGAVEENTKRPKGRMMPSIPTSVTSGAVNQPSAMVRPSRFSTNSVPKSPKLEEETNQDSLGYNINMVKGLLKSMRASSPRGVSATGATTTTSEVPSGQRRTSITRINSESNGHSSAINTIKREVENLNASVAKPTTTNTLQTEIISSPPASPTCSVVRPGDSAPTTAPAPKLSNINDSPFTSPESRDIVSPKNDTNAATTHARKMSDENNSPRSSPIRDVVSPSGSAPSTTRAQILSDTSDSPRSSPTQEIVSPRDSVTATARARIVSDKTENRSRTRKLSEQKSKSLTRCVSEADLTTKRQRSRTVSSSTSLKSPRSSMRRKSSSGTNLQRASSTSSLSIKAGDTNTKQQRDEPTRLYIRGRSLNLYPPSDFVEDKNVGLPPEQKLQLEWVYGYRGRDCRDNLFYIPTGELVYNMAAVVVLYNQETGKQRHYLGHNDDVKSIALHPNKLYIASGQVAGHDKEEGRPHVRVWDSTTLETLQVLGIGHFERAISCLAFTIKDEGRHLVVVDESNEHAISHWDWQNKKMISENKGSSDPVLMTLCHPHDQSVIVSCGKSHIAFWTVLESGGLLKKMGVYGKFDKPRFVLCMCFLNNGNLLTGDSNGNIFEWPQGTNHIGKAITGAHEGAVFSLCALDDGGFMSGGGRDRLIVLWSETYQPLKEIELPESAGPVRSIARGIVNENEEFQVAVGTTKNSLLAGTFDDGLTSLVTGHTDELWGLAVHPTRRMFVTCGYDKQIMLCSADNHTVIWKKQFEESLQSAAFHPKAFVLAIGTQSGNWMVLDFLTGDQLASFHDGPEQLDAIKYSPDGNYIAVGSHDNFIYLYTVSEDGRTYKRHGKLSGHSSFVTHIDWSSDSQYLQSNSGDYENLYWHAYRCKQVVSAYSMRDIKWETWTCVLGFPACGIWPEGADGTDINACCGSTSREFLVTGDDFGQVNFFRYPVTKLKSDCQNCLGHSSHVTCVRFTCDDTRVISTGGKDCSVMQWRIMS